MKKKKKITLMLAITSLTIFMIHIINKAIFFFSTLKEILYSDNSNFYKWRFGKIFYTKKGTGSPILLIHDLDSISSDLEWKEVKNALSSEHTVYTVDLLGCGRSDKPEITYTTFLYVQLISDFIKNIIKQPTDVIVTGHASASIIMTCYSDPTLFNNLILVNPDSLSSMNQIPTHRDKIIHNLLNMPIIGTFVYNLATSTPMIQKTFSNNYFVNNKKISSKYLYGCYEAAHLGGSASKYLYSSIQTHYTNTNIIHALGKIDNNIAVLGGDLEKDIDCIFEQYTECNPSIQINRIKSAKHLPQIEQPEKFLSVLPLYLSDSMPEE